MKRFGSLLGMILVIGLLSGCGKEDLGNSYVEGKDHQYMWEDIDSFAQRRAKGENGYFFRQGSYIYYLPEGANVLVPLCNKVDCMHTKEEVKEKYEECNAYIGMDGTTDGISYYDGYLYFLKTEMTGEGLQRLYRIKEDGSGKEVVHEWEGIAVEDWCLHRGEFFYTEPTFYEDEETRGVQEHFCIKKVEVDGALGTPQLVYEPPEAVSVYILSHLNAYGNYFYFYVVGGTGTLEQSQDEENWLDYHYGRQVVINLLTDERGEITVPNAEIGEDVNSVTFWQDKLVYLGYNHADELGLSAKTDIYIAELNGSDAKILLSDVPQGCRIMTDDDYLYLTNTALVIRGEEEKQIYQVYNKELQLVDTMEVPYTIPNDIAMGDEKGFYFFKGISEEDVDLLFFDKSTIGTYQGAPFSYTKIADWEYSNADLEE